VHGSALFQRGETQILGVSTLNMLDMEQKIDTLSPETTKRYMHNYNFPPFSTGETGRVGSPKRREIGHGALAERALVPVLPTRTEFPYAIRQVSEALGSNGSTSMGSVCASTMSLLNAGVPLKAPVAGIAMGLMSEDVDGETRYIALTDILGAEDALGDMDFKVAGTRDFVTALQLDTKLNGIPASELQKALLQARDARHTLLDVMGEAIDMPDEMSPYAPRIISLRIPVDKIGEVIGPKGKVINTIQDETGANISLEDDGTVYVGAESGEAAEAAVALQVAPTDAAIATSVLIQPKTGLIVAMAQSRPDMGTGKGETYWNYNASKALGGAEGYQAGSTFKTFTIASALDQGMTPQKTYNAPGQMQFRGQTFKNCDGSFTFNQDYNLGNQYLRGYGTINMLKAAQNSVNTYFMQLIRDTGICSSIEMAQKAGVELASGDSLKTMQNYPSFVLGTADVTPISMAEAYATFANRGKHCNPIILEAVETVEGANLEVPDANCKQVIKKDVADGVNYILQSVAEQGTGRPAAINDGRDEAGKTGTTNNATAVWYAGYTPELAGVAMIAVDKTNDYWEGRSQSLTGLRVAGGYLAGTGGGDAGLIWKAAMKSALRDLPKTSFTQPSDEILEGVKVKVPDVSGMSYNEAKETLEAAGFSTQRWGIYSNYSVGTFLGISPPGTATKFSTISLKVSVGPKPVAAEPEKEEDKSSDNDKKDDSKKDDSKKDDSKKDDKDDGD